VNHTTLGLLAITTLFSSAAAVVGTLLVLGLASPQPVQAAPDKKELHIALVNLERICRSTPKFKALKKNWDDTQSEFKEWNEELDRDYKLKFDEIKRIRVANPDDEMLGLRVELQAIEQALKAAREEQEQYLASLLAYHQKEVIEDVYTNLQRYVRQEGYNLVLQDYENANENADFFSGAAYAQSMMSRPVLDAPWALDGDPHVTDITAVMIKFMRAGGVPEKED
jgi:Skp family chaperone for outer membrane proteins